MTDPRKPDRSVNRLLDIVVEEVSLVDRAANEHRFLIVKRDTPMADHSEPNTQDTNADVDANADALGAVTDDGTRTSTPAPAPPTESDPPTPSTPASDPLLATAVAALEGLTSTVELLSSMGVQAADGRLAPLATELQATADALLARAGTQPTPSLTESGNAEQERDASESDTLAEHVAATRAALAELASLMSGPAASPPPTAGPAEPASPPDNLATTLAAMNESFRALADTVKEQHQRLARVEKQFGLPNSSQGPEPVRKATPEEVGWPMDLNNPMDRESVDKAISFHDL